MELVFVAASMAWLADQLRARWPHASGARRGLAIAGGTVATLAAIVLGQTSATLAARIDVSGVHYRLTENATLLDADGFALIDQLPALVTDGKTVAVDPWSGGSLAYGLAGVATTSRYVDQPVSPTLQIIYQRLADASTDPSVCQAVRELNLGYVLDFGPANRFVPAFHAKPLDMPGLWDVAAKPGFTLIAHHGQGSLYRIDACGA